MRHSLQALLFVSLSSLTNAQVLPGDLLLSSFDTPDILVQYHPDGTVVQTTGPGSGSGWVGAAILPNGNWVTTRRKPCGINIFDGVSGAQVASWDMPPGFTGTSGDVGVFSDGTLVVVQVTGRVWHFDIDGSLIAKWNVTANPFGLLVDVQDHVWTCDWLGGLLRQTDKQGNMINQFSTGKGAGDVTMAQDGTLFVTRRNTGRVAHYTQDGTFLGGFKATGQPATDGIAMGADKTLWVTGQSESLIRNFDLAGNLLGSFSVGPATFPVFLTIPVTGFDIGTNYCGPANPNSTAQPAVISAFGFTKASFGSVTLTASQLPKNVFGYFLNSQTQAFRPLSPGSQGNLCLGGSIGRHLMQIGSSGPAGELIIDLDLTDLPQPNGPHTVIAGETWNFQCWFRDANPGPTSNFTDGIEIVFQ